MTTETEKFRLTCGDILKTVYDGNMYVNTETGAQYATQGEAMRQILVDYMLSCGEDMRDENGGIDHIDIAEHGEWIEGVDCPNCQETVELEIDARGCGCHCPECGCTL